MQTIYSQPESCERWGVYELALPGKTAGNPFADYNIQGVFQSSDETVRVSGFYDGGGVYRIRFMPSFEGQYTYTISGSFSDETTRGTFQAVAPGENNHGPVRVKNQFHLAYADGKPHYSVGTTCYAFALQKRNLMIFGSAVDIVGYAILFLTPNVTVATAALGLVGLGMGFRQSMYFSIMPDIFDYTEWQFGKNMGGTQNAVNGFLNKVASAISGALTSALLIWCAYEANITELNELAAAGTPIASAFPQINLAFKIAYGAVSVVSCLIGLLLMLPYDLDKKYAEIRADLNDRQQ